MPDLSKMTNEELLDSFYWQHDRLVCGEAVRAELLRRLNRRPRRLE